MATVRKNSEEPTPRRRSAARTPKELEDRMILKSMELAEKQISNGTASSQVLTHFLKLASSRNEIEVAKLHRENLLLEAKVQSIQQASQSEELARQALDAMRGYSVAFREDDDG